VKHIIFLFFIIAFSCMTVAFFLGILYHLKERKQWKFKGLLFLGYILFLFFLGGAGFYLEEIAGLAQSKFYEIFRLLHVVGYSLLIYYLPATINYLLNRPWKRNRLFWIVLAAFSYFCAGTVLKLKGISPLWNLPLGIFFFTALVFVLLDGLRSLPLVRDNRGRITVTMLYSGTFIFLPLLLVARIIGPHFFHVDLESSKLYFPVQALYFFWLSCSLIQFLMFRILASDNVPLPLSERPLAFFEEKGITSREREIILCLEKGLTYKEIGQELFISAHTVSNHVASIYKKTGVRSRVEMLNALRGAVE
jgi:DNA-binding CsgD family transcriptional regulator